MKTYTQVLQDHYDFFVCKLFLEIGSLTSLA